MVKFDIRKFASVVAQLGPIVLSLAGVPPELINLITHGIVVAEGLKGATGAEKKASVVELVKTGAAGFNVVKPGTSDPEQVAASVSHGIDAVIEAVHTVQNIPVKHVA